MIPRNVDDYEGFLDAFPRQLPAEQVGNPLWHIHDGQPPVERPLPAGLTFGMLLNLASVANAAEPAVLWGFIARYAPGTTPDELAAAGRPGRARDRLLSRLRARRPAATARRSSQERAAMEELRDWLAGAGAEADAEAMQYELYEIGKRHALRQSARLVQGASTRCCSARARGRASAPSSRSTALPRRAR